MASHGNPNPHQPPFDLNNFFMASSLDLNPQNPSDLGAPSGYYFHQPSGTYRQFPPELYNYPFFDDHLMHPYVQRSVSFPTPPVPPVYDPLARSTTPGARLMAMLGNPAAGFDYSYQGVGNMPLSSMGGSDFGPSGNVPDSGAIQPFRDISAAVAQPAPVRVPSSKLPRGRRLVGDHVVYDVDARLEGEVQPQLEVTPITKYASDPELILGRQIAVNKMYICYGLRQGAIRVLNINTALRALLRDGPSGHTKRVTDMAFFAEDVDLLASASIEGRVFVWRISEDADEEDKPQILTNIVFALHISGVEGSLHPRVCWHCHKEVILLVAIGKNILRIDTTKVGKTEDFAATWPLSCPLDNLIDGVRFIGSHDGEVTALSMCQWMTTRLVSASKDGTIKIWDDRKAQPLVVLRPHDGYPVDAALFLSSPHRPDHIILITAGPQNKEVKLWASSSEEGWLLPCETESWRCLQTLELKSSVDPQPEHAFFNQVVELSQVGLLVFANAKKSAIYVVHLKYGDRPVASCMDYLAEFSVTMPILSCTGTSDVLLNGEHVVQIYCVQTQAIQQYALDLTQCLPPPLDNWGLEKPNSILSQVEAIEVFAANSEPLQSGQASSFENTPHVKDVVISASDSSISREISSSSKDAITTSVLPVVDPTIVASPSIPLSPKFGEKHNDLQSDQVSSDRVLDRLLDGAQMHLSGIPSQSVDRTLSGNVPDPLNPSIMYRHPTHLVTPFEIMATLSSEDTSIAKEKGEVAKIKVVDEAGLSQVYVSSLQGEANTQIKRKEDPVSSQAPDLGADLSKELPALQTKTSVEEDPESNIIEVQSQPVNSVDELDKITNDIPGKLVNYSVATGNPILLVPSTRDKSKKGKTSQASGPSTSPSVSEFSESLKEAGAFSSLPLFNDVSPKIVALEEMINQLVTAQKEMQNEVSALVNGTITKVARKLEATLGRSIEKAAKANSDDLWARFHEENAKTENLIRDRMQQVLNAVTSFANRDSVGILEKTMKKEMATMGATLARTITPVIEKAITSSVAESFQKGVSDKALNQLEKSVSLKIEATIGRQIQAQFQTSGRQALQEGLKTTMEASLIPPFEMSCKAMFEQIDAAFQKGMAEHTSSVYHQMDTAHSPLALALKDAISSASSITQTLSGDLADGQRKIVDLAVAGARSQAANPLATQLSSGHLAALLGKVEQPFDPTKELSRLISERKYVEAFITALQRSDVSIVSWLCSQVDLPGILAMVPTPLSQGVLLSLLQQLSCDIGKDTPRKLAWMTEVAAAINPSDPAIALHVRPIFEQVYQILNQLHSLPTTTTAELSSIRIAMHVINSMLMTYK